MHELSTRLASVDLSAIVASVGPRLLGALLILLIGAWLAARLANFSQRALRRAKVDDTLGGFLRNLIYGVLIAVLVAMVLAALGVSPAPMVAALGTAGLAIGLALQGSLSNLAWGVLLIMFRPFRVGDYVTAGGIDGTVQSIDLMYTQVLLPDGREAAVPNAKVGSDAILNFNRRGTRRVDLKIGVGWRDDLTQAMATLQQVLADEPLVLTEPAPGVWVDGIAGQTVTLVLRGWVKSPDVWATQTALLRAVKQRIDAGELSLPATAHEVSVVQGAVKGGAGAP
ncbi:MULTISPECIES: mechanosensitive ion channel family protein [unclassified Rhodanobacter]|uniref:Small-conductance mechanosensitive channel n=1 Tax=Rhodanobacter humi TaxID=1888173 RepID=A0ABV4AP94_9GAMM